MNKTTLTTAVISAVAGGAIGGVITYLTVNKTLRTRYAEQADSEIEDVKRRYALLRKDDGDLTILQMAQNPSAEVQAAVDKGRRIIESMGYSSPLVGASADETRSIFDQGIDPEDIPDEDEPSDEEIRNAYTKIEGEPFKIEEADYFENEAGYELDTLTYYAVDDTLCDENNSQIDRVQETIGERHLHMFHKDLQAKSSIYIQNDSHQTLYEVILIEGSYASVVLGMDDETLGIKAPKERPRRMRDGD